ncbi:MAG TPA: SynChlorMet cassette radical SAM/SPASM protein ScmE [Victivallales bacterium]|nr:SynChlorMet cassette radical SAM/SPASM protein ScmE [Victivallales bacterium]
MQLMKTPKSVDLNITTKCNLRCSYCSHFSSEGETGKDLPTEEWLKFFEELRDCAVLDVCLSGGEPFFRKDIKELITGIVANRMRFSMLSNGSLITEEILDFIKSTGRCNSIQVSIDGPGPESHDISRGKGSFNDALRGLKLLIKHKLPATTRVTIHKHNFNDLDKVAKLLLEDVGLPSFSTNSASHLGLCRENSDDTQLNADEYSFVIAKLFELNKKYNGRIGAQAGPLASGKHWKEMEDTIKAGIKETPGCGYLRSCGGVFSKMAVRADGIMIPCSQIPHIELGRINKDNLREVWHNHTELKRLRERRDMPLKKFAYCSDCKYTPYCRGGCPALAYTLTGNENEPSPDSCYRTFLEAGGELPN